MTFLRFQEHYESPRFRGKIFSLDEFKKWYVKNSKKGKSSGMFTYCSDWGGFNIPSYVLKPFYEGRFDPLSKKEKNMLDIFRNKTGKFYIIGTFGRTAESKKTLKHEVAHGLFYTNPDYKKGVLKILNTLGKSALKKVHAHLGSKTGYHESVFTDETHAYILTGMKKLVKKKVVSPDDINSVNERLNALFDRYY
jgi:hypothetical protein